MKYTKHSKILQMSPKVLNYKSEVLSSHAYMWMSSKA